MTNSKIVIAIAAAATLATLAPAAAMPVSLAPAQALAAETQSLWQPVVWQCMWKKVCVKWNHPHHDCLRWTQKKVCNPDVTKSPTPQPTTNPIMGQGLTSGTDGAADPTRRPATLDMRLPAVQAPRPGVAR